ncbi:hypothetical protein LG634_14450 [Streptomyces bambusae]|uniref:hypothetical protein n=1 Tax=Streptomyces bambusae TaxID=1550616 RepID=UPI001CFDBEAF|nr:hypothetical protein [Streptomyces bambusae]MCB5166032.1 hypothetical protein [Streptomyces bambusae]
MTTPLTIEARRAQVRQLAHGGASNRIIAAQLGISKDTVRRDLAQQPAPAGSRTERLAHRVAQAEAAVSQACAAAQAVADAAPAYTITDDATAARWYAALRAAADQLAAHADAFGDYYPRATG